MAKAGQLKVCPQGHEFRKSSVCPTCPTCEATNKPDSGFLAELSAPARRALENAGITTLARLAKHSKKEVLSLHGVGASTLPTLERALKAQGLAFAG